MSVIRRTGIAVVRVEEETIGADPQVLHVWIPTTKRIDLYALAVVYAKEEARVIIRPPRPRTKPHARPIDGRDWQRSGVDRWAAQMLIHRYTDAHDQSDPTGLRHKTACLYLERQFRYLAFQLRGQMHQYMPSARLWPDEFAASTGLGRMPAASVSTDDAAQNSHLSQLDPQE